MNRLPRTPEQDYRSGWPNGRVFMDRIKDRIMDRLDDSVIVVPRPVYIRAVRMKTRCSLWLEGVPTPLDDELLEVELANDLADELREILQGGQIVDLMASVLTDPETFEPFVAFRCVVPATLESDAATPQG